MNSLILARTNTIILAVALGLLSLTSQASAYDGTTIAYVRNVTLKDNVVTQGLGIQLEDGDGNVVDLCGTATTGASNTIAFLNQDSSIFHSMVSLVVAAKLSRAQIKLTADWVPASGKCVLKQLQLIN